MFAMLDSSSVVFRAPKNTTMPQWIEIAYAEERKSFGIHPNGVPKGPKNDRRVNTSWTCYITVGK